MSELNDDLNKAALIANALNRPLREVLDTVRDADRADVDQLVERCHELDRLKTGKPAAASIVETPNEAFRRLCGRLVRRTRL